MSDTTATETDPTEAIASLPTTFDDREFNDYLKVLKDSHLDVPLKRAYAKSGSKWIRIRNSGVDEKPLFQKYTEINWDKWRSCVAVYLVAQYIYEHRMKVGRKGDQMDDYVKAEYLVGLVRYLNQKRQAVIRLQQDDEMEEIIDAVNNIFDSAYFRKLNHPELTDTQCFFEAEREFCEDKDIDFLLYQERLGDHRAAERLHVEQNIRTLAYRNFESRTAAGTPGSDLKDWVEAEKKYPEWRIKRRIATICWNLSADKRQPQDYYWLQACRVVDELDRRGVAYANENPYASVIYDVIVKVVRPQEEPAK